jgi:hypothetical protein
VPAPSPLRPSVDVLRRLYVDERLSSPEIARQCQVEKITVLRWLRAADIERRPIGRGLANRGIKPPTAEELHRLIHIEHLGYRGVADLYGVDHTAVSHWLTKHGIAKPTVWQTRRPAGAREPSEQELRDRISRGESLTSITKDFDINRSTLTKRCRSYGIEVQHDGWQKGIRYPCADGHQARSLYEQRVDNWLHEHGINHEVEPAYPWDRRYRADFRVADIYIEVWGVTQNAAYTARRTMKIRRCKEAGIDLISINVWQFAKGRRWWRPLQRLQQITGDLPDRLF